MSPFRCAGENGMRVESWDTFRTETQRGTEAAGQACLAQRGIHKKYQYLLYILGRFHIIRLRPEQRARRGTASQFPAQRGGCGLLKRNTENPSFLKNLLCGNGCEAAI